MKRYNYKMICMFRMRFGMMLGERRWLKRGLPFYCRMMRDGWEIDTSGNVPMWILPIGAKMTEQQANEWINTGDTPPPF